MGGKLIVLEGTDGAGKTTQARLLARQLGWRRIDCSRGGALRSPEDIHSQLWDLVRGLIAK